MADEVAQREHHPAELALLHSTTFTAVVCTCIVNRRDSYTSISPNNACTCMHIHTG